MRSRPWSTSRRSSETICSGATSAMPVIFSSKEEQAAATGHSRALRRKIRLANGRMFHALDRFWTQPDLPERYPELLFHLHCVVRATVPAMEAARRKAE